MTNALRAISIEHALAFGAATVGHFLPIDNYFLTPGPLGSLAQYGAMLAMGLIALIITRWAKRHPRFRKGERSFPLEGVWIEHYEKSSDNDDVYLSIFKIEKNIEYNYLHVPFGIALSRDLRTHAEWTTGPITFGPDNEDYKGYAVHAGVLNNRKESGGLTHWNFGKLSNNTFHRSYGYFIDSDSEKKLPFSLEKIRRTDIISTIGKEIKNSDDLKNFVDTKFGNWDDKVIKKIFG